MQQAHPSNGSSENGRLPTEQWQGQEVAFMRSNEHSKDRRGSWHPEGLEGAALHLVQGDEKNGRYDTHHAVGPAQPMTTSSASTNWVLKPLAHDDLQAALGRHAFFWYH